MKDRKLWKNVLKLVWILYVIINIIVWIPVIDGLFTTDYESTSNCISLNSDWDIMINNEAYHDVSLDDFRFEAVGTGDRIVMERNLPSYWDIVEGTLRLHIRHSAVRMYIDGRQVYEYGYDRMRKNKTIGSGYQFINFPDKYRGQKIKLELEVNEQNAFTKFDPIQIYGWENAYRALLTENRIPLFLGGFLTVFGLCILLITAFALVVSTKYIRFFCIAAFCICVGLWTLCYYNILVIFAIPLYSVCLIEYMTLYLSPLPLIIYMYGHVKNLKSKVLKVIYWILFTVQLVFDLVFIGLHTMDIVHCASVLQYFQVIIICHLIYFMLIDLKNLKSSQLMNRFYLVGLLIVAVCIGYDLFVYYEERYHSAAIASFRGLSALGMMFLVFILIISFYMNLAHKMMQDAERSLLLKSAYTDELTQLHNRRYCSEQMVQLNEDKTAEYTVISFDLNNLKTVNDTYGHAKGDILIKSAADVIGKTFEEQGFVGRMGGDEFLAVLLTADKKRIEGLMEQFKSNILKKNQEVEDLDMSISCGYASSNEIEDRDIEKIYQKADDRMYADKKQYKLRTGRTSR